ncbi:MAF protein [Marinobacter daqiaonensis]|uniref:7-methyl-GTP pyrophosphatase n=1 Tax=Marinobacter daqiaonensis TaxID=650891 RepID=A0A1I6H3V1_9GAMM|nr:Maf family nucleotide pyrophosphatase [Marinobacter daqiaonensis]SFR49155.1 MAF protein [Marinobacter daqiaonensis]
MPQSPALVLASSSPWRRELLERLELPFEWASPDIDESPTPGETAPELVERLSAAKARALGDRYPAHLIIGSDQVAALANGTILGKPGNHERACEQLAECSGQSVAFFTGLALYDSAGGAVEVRHETFTVRFRTLSWEEIDGYLKREQPYQCAGSFRMEGLGITLFEGFEGRDPNTLVGLPLMALTDLLRARGLNPLTFSAG